MTLAPLPLHRFPLCRSSDVHEFTDRLDGVHHPATVVPGGDVEVTPVEVTPVDDITTVDLALAGWLVAVSGSDEVPVRPGHASVHSPRRAHVLRARAGSELHRADAVPRAGRRRGGAMLGRPVTGPVRLAAGSDPTGSPTTRCRAGSWAARSRAR